MMLFLTTSLMLMIVFGASIKMCVLFDEADKCNRRRMLKYKKWMFFVFRYQWDTSGNKINRSHKIFNKTNAENISVLSFCLQIVNLIVFICVMVMLGIICGKIEEEEYTQLMTLFWIYLGYGGILFVTMFIYYSITLTRTEKRFMATEKQQNDVIRQQPTHREESAPPVEETSLDQLAPTTASDSDNYNPYLQ